MQVYAAIDTPARRASGELDEVVVVHPGKTAP